MTAASLEITDLHAGYGATRVIEGITLSVPAGGRLAVLGRNGVGKTTLLAALVGQARHHSGQITIDGVDLVGLRGMQRALAGVGYVPQHRAIFRSLSVEENLIAGLRGTPRSDLEDAYRQFPKLRDRRHAAAANLSGGEQQMLAIARTLLGRPRLLLLDEPLEGLAPAVCDQIMAMLDELATAGTMTIVLVEQNVGRAIRFADRVVILSRGQIAWQGTSTDLQADTDAMDRLLALGSAELGA